MMGKHLLVWLDTLVGKSIRLGGLIEPWLSQLHYLTVPHFGAFISPREALIWDGDTTAGCQQTAVTAQGIHKRCSHCPSIH